MIKGFCAAPFTTLIINADGKVGCCREKGTEHFVGNALTQSLEEIWNGEEIKKWRREFLTGNIQTCKKEQHDMSCNLFKHNMELMPYVSPQEFQEGHVLRLSPDINGSCNLKCPMCIVWKKPNGKYDLVPNFWENLEANVLPHLKIMDPLSGEPFIQKDLYKIIRMTAKVNPNCRWNFTTNAQWEMTPEIRSHLDMIKIDLISISVDSVNEETYSKIRKGGSLQVLKNNISELIKYKNEREVQKGEKINLVLNFTMQNDNAYELESMFDFTRELGINPLILFLYDPEEMSVEKWIDGKKIELIKYYFRVLDKQSLLNSNRFFMATIRSLKNQIIKKKLFSMYDLITDGKIGMIQDAAKDPIEYLRKLTTTKNHV